MCIDVHARRVVPDEEGLAILFGLFHEILGEFEDMVIHGLHVVLDAFGGMRRQRTFVYDLLLADLAPALLHGRVIPVGGPGVEQVTRAIFFSLRFRHGRCKRILHGIEVVEIAEKLIKAVQRRQVFVEVAEVVLAELPGGVAVIFERSGNGRGRRRHTDIRTGLSDGGQAGTLRQFAGDEVGPPCGTTRLGVIIGKDGTLGGQLVDVGSGTVHQSATVSADVPHANVIAHNHNNVRFFVLCIASADGQTKSEQQ